MEKDAKSLIKEEKFHENEQQYRIEHHIGCRNIEINQDQRKGKKQDAFTRNKVRIRFHPCFSLRFVEKDPIYSCIEELFDSQERPKHNDINAQQHVGGHLCHEEVVRGLGVVKKNESGQKTGLQVEEYRMAYFGARLGIGELLFVGPAEKEILQMFFRVPLAVGKNEYDSEETAEQDGGDPIVVAQQIGKQVRGFPERTDRDFRMIGWRLVEKNVVFVRRKLEESGPRRQDVPTRKI